MTVQNVLKTSILLLGFALLSGCSSCGAADTANSNPDNSNNVTVITPQKAVDGRPGPDNSNSKLVPYPGTEDGKNPTLDESKVKVIDMSKVKPKPPVPRRMGDGSEILTVQSSDGLSFIETRKFNNQEQLDKIVRTSKSPKDRVVKVYLRNGKVVTIDNEKLKNFATDSADSILLLAGIKTKPTPLSAGDGKNLMKVKP